MEEFAAVFADLQDPRTGNAQRHALLEILLIGLCTVLCGGETCTDMVRFGRAKWAFLKQFLTLKHGIPATTPSAGSSGCSIRSSSTPASWPSCAALPRAVRAWWPWTARRC